jgi:hypothetical protein
MKRLRLEALVGKPLRNATNDTLQELASKTTSYIYTHEGLHMQRFILAALAIDDTRRHRFVQDFWECAPLATESAVCLAQVRHMAYMCPQLLPCAAEYISGLLPAQEVAIGFPSRIQSGQIVFTSLPHMWATLLAFNVNIPRITQYFWMDICPNYRREIKLCIIHQQI